MTTISVVSPVYRAASCVEELYRRLDATLRAMPVEREIVLVEDGGGDGAAEAIARLAAADPHVVALLLGRNRGQHAAIAAGLAKATGDWVVVMDCDLQDRPEEIPRLFAAAMDQAAEVVVARRLHRKQSRFRRLGSRAWFAIVNRLGPGGLDPAFGAFSLVHRRVADAWLASQRGSEPYLLVLHRLGFRWATVDVDHGERFAGRSAYSLVRLARLAAGGIRTARNR